MIWCGGVCGAVRCKCSSVSFLFYCFIKLVSAVAVDCMCVELVGYWNDFRHQFPSNINKTCSVWVEKLISRYRKCFDNVFILISNYYKEVWPR